MQGALALQMILLERHLCEEGVLLAIQHDLQKVVRPNKVGEVTSACFRWKITTTEFYFEINTSLKYINRVKRTETNSF